jgi:Methyltransferase domain
MYLNPANFISLSRWNSKVTFRVDDGDALLLDQPGTLLLPMQRDRLLRYLPSNARVAEIGVAKGHFTQQVRTVCKPSFYALVDPWRHQSENVYYGDSNNAAQADQDRRHDAVSKRFASNKPGRECKVFRMFSADAVKEFPDRYFDWVFVDANHSYEACLEDLRLWAPKVRDDGLICGHDFAVHGAARAAKFGVVDAVKEFANETGFALAALTIEHFPTFVVAKSPQGETVKRLRQLILSYEPHVIQVSDAARSDIKHARLLDTGLPRGAFMSFDFFKPERL